MSVQLSPQNKVYVELKQIDRKNLPKICLSLDSGDRSQEKPAVNGLENCNSCRVLKRLVCVKDIAISRLTEDRDELKLKLTKINNQNIELTQKLKRLENEKRISEKKTKKDKNYEELRAKYEESEAINRHLRQHLNTLKLVFNELHNTSESTSNDMTNTTHSTNNTTNTSTSTSVPTLTRNSDRRK